MPCFCSVGNLRSLMVDHVSDSWKTSGKLWTSLLRSYVIGFLSEALTLSQSIPRRNIWVSCSENFTFFSTISFLQRLDFILILTEAFQ